MKSFLLKILNQPLLGTVIGFLGRGLRRRERILGFTNPLHVSHYLVERNGLRYLAEMNSYLARSASGAQRVKFNACEYEPELSYLTEKLIGLEDFVLDIGANVGLHTVAFARKASAGHVYAFEPVAEMAEQASRNCALNGLDNVTIIRYALGEAAGTAEMNVNVSGGGLEGTSSFLDTVHVVRDPRGFVPRRIIVHRLDDIIEDLAIAGKISFIKIDVEGFEPMVINGGLATIRRHRPVMLIEAHSTRLEATGHSFSWYLENFPEYHILTVHGLSAANSYLKLEPLAEEPPEVAVNLLFLPRTRTWAAASNQPRSAIEDTE